MDHEEKVLVKKITRW